MEKIAFTMQLNPGQKQEYRRRHQQIWPELVDALKAAGIRDYSIFLEESTHTLFAVLWRSENHSMDALPLQAIVQKWWAYMADIMATEADNKPRLKNLEQMFHLD